MAKHTIGEEWRPVAGYGNFYEISNRGNLRLAKDRGYRKAGRKKKHATSRFGYIRYQLNFDGRRVMRLAHRLVLEAFVGARPQGHECNHKNGIKHDNRVENLEWVTKSTNAKHAIYDIKTWKVRVGEESKLSKLTKDQVIEIRRLKSLGHNVVELSIMFGVDPSHIYNIARRGSWKHV